LEAAKENGGEKATERTVEYELAGGATNEAA
jgi:hypothetical protein